MRETFRVTEAMRSADPSIAAGAYIRAGMKLIVTHGVDDDRKCTCGQADCSSPGKHPLAKYFGRGVRDASNDILMIRRALKEYPDANLAVALAGTTVVDVDGRNGERVVEGAGLPKTIRVKTHRGYHRYFVGEIPGGSFKVPEVDVLVGSGRYVMLPPSVHESGHVYRWVTTAADRPAPASNSIAALRTTRKVRLPELPRSQRVAVISKGERNDSLFRIARDLRRRLSDDALVSELMAMVNERACEEPLAARELQTLTASSAKYSDKDADLFGPPSQRTPLPMEWLWYPYIPRYGVTILAGNPGVGKSILTALLIGIVTSGSRLPLADEAASGRRVLLLSAEDDWARVTVARLLKANANISNIHTMRLFRALTDDRLEQMRAEIEIWRPDLVIIDTLSAYMGGDRDMHRQNEVGEFLGMLTEMAESTGAAILGLAHLNKQSTEPPLYRIVGSIGFVASIRSALFFGLDPENPERLALAHGKANASELGKTIIFERQGSGRDVVQVLKPVGFSDADPTEVCSIPRRPVGRPPSESEEAAAFVLEFLTDIPVSWNSVLRAAEKRAIASEGTLNNVRSELAKAGQIAQIGKGPRTRWRLTDARAHAGA